MAVNDEIDARAERIEAASRALREVIVETLPDNVERVCALGLLHRATFEACMALSSIVDVPPEPCDESGISLFPVWRVSYQCVENRQLVTKHRDVAAASGSEAMTAVLREADARRLIVANPTVTLQSTIAGQAMPKGGA